MQVSRTRNVFYAIALVTGLMVPLLGGLPAQAAAIAVNTTDDEYNTDPAECSLREAIAAANTNTAVSACTQGTAGQDTIAVPAGTYNLTIGPAGDDVGVSGDLDITEAATIDGVGATTIVRMERTQLNDRVFHVSGTTTATLSDLTITNGNKTGERGGGVLAGAGTDVTLSAVTVTANHGNQGGGVAVNATPTTDATMTITGSIVSNNTAVDFGGGILNGFGTMDITNTQITGNSTSNGPGGGISAGNADTSISSSTIDGNSAAGNGGGIHQNTCCFDPATLTLTDSTVSNNDVEDGVGGFGAGLYHNGGDSTVTNTTFNNNVSTMRTGAAAVESHAPGQGNNTLAIVNSTIASNTHGVRASGGMTLKNTIVADSDGANGDCSDGTVASTGNNLIESVGASCTITSQSNEIIGQDPKLDPLGDYGGSTETQALKSDSPALDAGTNTGCPSTDQRGYSRPADGPDAGTTATCDIGAYEARTISINDVTHNEGNGPGDTTFDFTITLSAPAPEEVRFFVQRLFGTAEAADFSSCSPDPDCADLFTLPAGVTSTVFTVNVTPDHSFEPNETFDVVIDNGPPSTTNFIFADDDGRGTILNDDAAPEHGRAITLTLSRHLRAEGRVSVPDGFKKCRRNVPVTIQRKKSGEWVRVKGGLTTSRRGRYSTELNDRAGTYRAVTPPLTKAGEVCRKAISPTKNHTH